MLTSEIHHDQPAIGEDPSSVSYILRSARTVPQALTVHTIYLKKITYPMTSRQPELWVLERNHDGLETWRPVETFLGNLQLSQDPRVLRAVANQWRLHYEVPPISSSSTTTALHPSLILNIRMYTLDNQSQVSPTPTSSNPAGDALHSITPKGHLYNYIGPHGVRHLLHHQRGRG